MITHGDCMYTHTSAYTHVHSCVNSTGYTPLPAHVHTLVHTHVRTPVCSLVHTTVHTTVCTHVHTHSVMVSYDPFRGWRRVSRQDHTIRDRLTSS